MYIKNKNFILPLLLILFTINKTILFSQDCQKPFSISYSERTPTTIQAKWSDSNNSNGVSYDIELLKRGNPRQFLPSITGIQSKSYSFQDLLPGTAYEFYLRSVCTDQTQFSDWNGPFLFTTVILNKQKCALDLPMKDNGTETFFIENPEAGILGEDIFLTNVKLIIQHGWPADLKITLVSPSGEELILSEHNGVGTDNYGDIMDTTCIRSTQFNDTACILLEDRSPPYIGTFKPKNPIAPFARGTNAQGLWRLICFDRAIRDAGILKHITLDFEKEFCIPPQNITIDSLGINGVRINWSDVNASCGTIKIALYDTQGDSIITFVDCSLGTYFLDNLSPNETYTVNISSVCSTQLSPSSCPIIFKTACEAVTAVEDWERQEICQDACNIACPILNSIWYNLPSDGASDWILWTGNTKTENTGPQSNDAESKYIYVETNNQVCPQTDSVILQSRCMSIISHTSGCDMSFQYYAYGADIGTLNVEISLDGGSSWTTIFTTSGDKGKVWHETTLNLTSYHNMLAVFRFTYFGFTGPFSDLAIDNITFYGSQLVTDIPAQYVDNDGDGYGFEVQSIIMCSSLPMEGYTFNAGDCDDTNPLINPSAIETPCTGTDENCNGIMDDTPMSNAIEVVEIKENESCLGRGDGFIQLLISGGTPPYNVSWSHNETGELLENLHSGIYYATITDNTSCKKALAPIIIGANTSLNTLVTDTRSPSCQGKSDGAIFIGVSGGTFPYSYRWNTGDTTRHLMDVSEGKYSLTITDISSCVHIFDSITLISNQKIVSDFQVLNPLRCHGDSTGSIRIINQNGSIPYTITWSNGQSGDILNQLTAGTYTATITDNDNCHHQDEFTLTDPLPLNIIVRDIQSVRCFGESNGHIITDITGGTPPYSFFWNNFQFTDDIFNLKSGDYSLTVTDNQACVAFSDTVIVTQPPPLYIRLDSIHPASCLASEDGYIQLSTEGGTMPYYYSWNHNSQSTDTFSNLETGLYQVTGYDQNGCKSNLETITIPYDNTPIDINTIVLMENDCPNDSNAIIAVELTNGSPPFDYNWSSGLQYFSSDNKDTIRLLPSGNYTLTITDTKGCLGVSQELTILDVALWSYTTMPLSTNICPDDTLAQLILNISGGNSPYKILWSNGDTTLTTSALPNGPITATIVDAKGCLFTIDPYTIASESNLSVQEEIVSSDPQSATGQICLNVSGQVPPIFIEWIDFPDFNGENCIGNIPGGTYRYIITDGAECVVSGSILLDTLSSIIHEWEEDNILIYPNPTNTHITIKQDMYYNSVELTDILQRKIIIQDLNEPTTILRVEDLNPGIYFIKLKNTYTEKTLIRKIIKI